MRTKERNLLKSINHSNDRSAMSLSTKIRTPPIITWKMYLPEFHDRVAMNGNPGNTTVCFRDILRIFQDNQKNADANNGKFLNDDILSD